MKDKTEIKTVLFTMIRHLPILLCTVTLVILLPWDRPANATDLHNHGKESAKKQAMELNSNDTGNSGDNEESTPTGESAPTSFRFPVILYLILPVDGLYLP